MQSFTEVIQGRRSIRRFTPSTIEKEKLTAVLEAARWTPSWANTQCWEIVVVQDAALKIRISEMLSPKNPATLAVAHGPVLLAICAATMKSGFYKGSQSTKFGDWFMYDLGLVTQTICLTAHNLGLGTVVVGSFEHDNIKNILCLPDGYELVALVPMGYPDHEPSAPKRKELEQFVHYDRFEIKNS